MAYEFYSRARPFPEAPRWGWAARQNWMARGERRHAPHDPAAPSPPPYRDDNLDRSPAKARFTSTRDKYGSPRVSKLTAGTVKLGGPLTPFPSEVMKPEPQGLVLVPKVKVDLARARYTKGRDMPSRPTSATTAHSATSMVHYQTTKERLLKEKEWERVRDFSLPNRAQSPPRPDRRPARNADPASPSLPPPASQVHPRQFIKVSRTARPGDREGMAPDPTVESARTALEKRRALEHEAAVAHLEKLRVEAIEERDAAVAERRALATAHIRREFWAQRERRKDWCERAVASASWKPMDANRLPRQLAAERDLALTYDPKGLAETMRAANTTYAAYFEEHARCTRATAKAEGGSKDAGSGRSSRCELEERESDARAVAELDDFDERVRYFHETSSEGQVQGQGMDPEPGGEADGRGARDADDASRE